MKHKKNVQKEEIEWTFPYMDCNTGPYWSNGKFQSSVSEFDCIPKSKLDRLSQEHDRSYALCYDNECLDLADMEYYNKTRSMSLGPRIIGNIVYYGNQIERGITGGRGRKMSEIYIDEKQHQKPGNHNGPKFIDKNGNAIPHGDGTSPTVYPTRNQTQTVYDPHTNDGKFIGTGLQKERGFASRMFGEKKKKKKGLFSKFFDEKPAKNNKDSRQRKQPASHVEASRHQNKEKKEIQGLLTKLFSNKKYKVYIE